MLPEKSQECKRFLADPHHGILYLLRRNESKAVLYPSVMLPDFFGQIIDGPVNGDGILTAAISPSLFRIPNGRIDRHFRSYLFPFGIYAYLAQQLACSVFTDFGTVYIKQYRKCTATFDFHIISISFHNPIFCHYQITTENLSATFLSNAFVSVSILLSVTFA